MTFKGQRTSLTISPLDRSHTTSYYRFEVTTLLFCIVSDVWRNIGRGLKIFPPQVYFASQVRLLGNVKRIFGVRKLEYVDYHQHRLLESGLRGFAQYNNVTDTFGQRITELCISIAHVSRVKCMVVLKCLKQITCETLFVNC